MNDYKNKLTAIRSKRLTMEQRMISGFSFIILWVVIICSVAASVFYGPLVISMTYEMLGESWAIAVSIISTASVILFLILSIWLMKLAFEQLTRFISGVAKDVEHHHLQ